VNKARPSIAPRRAVRRRLSSSAGHEICSTASEPGRIRPRLSQLHRSGSKTVVTEWGSFLTTSSRHYRDGAVETLISSREDHRGNFISAGQRPGSHRSVDGSARGEARHPADPRCAARGADYLRRQRSRYQLSADQGCAAAQGRAERAGRSDRRRGFWREQRLRRPVPDAQFREARLGRREVHPIAHHCAVLADAAGAAHRPQPSFGGHEFRGVRP
jgi:hypothetical protein